MKVLVIGGTGTIGAAVAEALSARHEVTVAGHSSGERLVDLESAESIRETLDAAGPFDAVVCCAGRAAFGPLDELSDEQFELSLRNKLMGQVDVIREALPRLREGGSVTVTTGVLAREPIPGSAAISMVNAGLEGFVRAAALEAPRGVRVNAVSPPWVSETLEAMGRDPSGGLPAATVANAYVAAVEGDASGEVLDAREHA